MRKKNINKLAIYNDDPLIKKLILAWGLPFESLMNSQSAGEKPQRIFSFVNKDDTTRLKALSVSPGMVIEWDEMYGQRFEPEYFMIDTTSGYKIMTYEELMK